MDDEASFIREKGNEMKRCAILIACLVLMLAAGCDLFQARSYQEIEPSAMPASGATSTPADGDAGGQVFLEFYEDFLTAGMGKRASAKSASPAGKDFKSVLKSWLEAKSLDIYKADEPVKHSVIKADLGYTGPMSEDGSADIKGSLSATFPYMAGPEPDLQVNTEYRDILRLLFNLDVFGTIENVELDRFVLVKAVVNNSAEASIRTDIKTGANPSNPMTGADVKLNAAFKLKMSEAYSVRRISDGMGAKFIITADVNAAKPDIRFTLGIDPDFSALVDYLNRMVLTVKVYDDSDQLKGSIEINLGMYLMEILLGVN